MTMITIKTYAGFELNVRRSSDQDGPLLEDFWKRVSPIDLDRRSKVGPHGGACATTTFLAFGGSGLVAIAVLTTDLSSKHATVMVFTDDRATYHGVSWALLEHVLAEARNHGVQVVESVFGAQDIRASRLEQKMGFVEVPHPQTDGLKVLRWTLAETTSH